LAVTIKDVERIAELAKLRFTEKEKKKLQGEMNKILEYMDKINELDLENVDPLENINNTENVFREDVPEKCLTR
jgi:aspartyl-tRNA(Asn)/glutamyl-tRNA(Gln) amidotransferase subunit C